MREKLVKEWIYKAEEDFEAAILLARKKRKPVPDVVCFHAQQCIEKYLKAYLIKNEIEPPQIHDLLRLNRLCIEVDREFEVISEKLEILNAYAVNFRYPGEAATVEEAKEALENAKDIRRFIKEKIGEKD